MEIESRFPSLRSSRSLPPMTVPAHGSTRYLRSRVEVRSGVLRWEVPRAVFGVLPIGSRTIEIPLSEVSSLTVRRTLQPLRFILGLAWVAIPMIFGLWWLAVPSAMFGIWVIAISVGPQLEVSTTTGTTRRAPFCFTHRFDAELYAQAALAIAEEVRQRA